MRLVGSSSQPPADTIRPINDFDAGKNKSQIGQVIRFIKDAISTRTNIPSSTQTMSHSKREPVLRGQRMTTVGWSPIVTSFSLSTPYSSLSVCFWLVLVCMALRDWRTMACRIQLSSLPIPPLPCSFSALSLFSSPSMAHLVFSGQTRSCFNSSPGCSSSSSLCYLSAQLRRGPLQRALNASSSSCFFRQCSTMTRLSDGR